MRGSASLSRGGLEVAQAPFEALQVARERTERLRTNALQPVLSFQFRVGVLDGPTEGQGVAFGGHCVPEAVPRGLFGERLRGRQGPVSNARCQPAAGGVLREQASQDPAPIINQNEVAAHADQLGNEAHAAGALQFVPPGGLYNDDAVVFHLLDALDGTSGQVSPGDGAEAAGGRSVVRPAREQVDAAEAGMGAQQQPVATASPPHAQDEPVSVRLVYPFYAAPFQLALQVPYDGLYLCRGKRHVNP